MKKRSAASMLIFILLAVTLAGCGAPAAATSAAPGAAQPGSKQPAAAASLPAAGQPVQPPPGSFNLPDAGANLDGLGAYQSTLVTAFNGTRGGRPYTAGSTLTRQLTQNPAASLTTLDSTSSDGQPLWMAGGEFDGLTFLQTGADQACQAASKDAGGGEFSLPDAAAQLPGITGAEKVGDETVGGVTAVRYHFDQRSLRGYPAGVSADGDVWVAVEGGFVVSYQLKLNAPEGVLGAGLAGEQSWAYEVKPGLQAVALPDACAGLPYDFPRMPDAAGVTLMDGYLDYLTAGPADAVSSFYNDRLTGQGWTRMAGAQAGQPGAADALLFKKVDGDKETTAWVDVAAAGAQTRVEVILSVVSPETAKAFPMPTPQAQPTLDLATAGLPAGVPLYPGAANITGMAGRMLSYRVDAGVPEVEKFYSEQLSAGGWQLVAPAPGVPWQKDGLMLVVVVEKDETAGTSVLITWMNAE